MEFEVDGTKTAGYVPGLIPDVASQLSAGALVDRETVEAELDIAMAQLRECWALEPDAVLLVVSAISARMTELQVHLHRVEGRDRRFKMLRTQQVLPIILECDRQAKLHSRLIEMRRQDLELARG